METVTASELRNKSAEVLRRVEAGESLQISKRGTVVAVIRPAGRSVLDDLIAQGSARPATMPISSLRDIEPVHSDVPTSEIIRDLRGEW